MSIVMERRSTPPRPGRGRNAVLGSASAVTRRWRIVSVEQPLLTGPCRVIQQTASDVDPPDLSRGLQRIVWSSVELRADRRPPA